MLYELSLYGRYYGQRVIYSWNYVIDAVPVGMLGSFALINAFGLVADDGTYLLSSIFAKLLAIETTSWTLERAVARAPSDYDVTDFYELVFSPPQAGFSSGGGDQAPQSAYGLTTNRVRTDIKPGSKRLAGVTDTSVLDGGALSSGAVTALDGLCTALSSPISFTSGASTATFDNCIVSKAEYTTPSGKRAYRYYDTLVEQLEHIARNVTWALKDEVTTQNSRKKGRGV